MGVWVFHSLLINVVMGRKPKPTRCRREPSCRPGRGLSCARARRPGPPPPARLPSRWESWKGATQRLSHKEEYQNTNASEALHLSVCMAQNGTCVMISTLNGWFACMCIIRREQVNRRRILITSFNADGTLAASSGRPNPIRNRARSYLGLRPLRRPRRLSKAPRRSCLHQSRRRSCPASRRRSPVLSCQCFPSLSFGKVLPHSE